MLDVNYWPYLGKNGRFLFFELALQAGHGICLREQEALWLLFGSQARFGS